MRVLIDNSDRGKIVFYYKPGAKWLRLVLADGEGGLPGAFNVFLKKTKKSMSEIEGVAALLGKGSFTAARLLTTFVNTISFALKIPVVGVREADLAGLDNIFKSAKTGKLVHPEYTGEANVGKTKK